MMNSLLEKPKESLLSSVKCRVKKIGIFLPVPYRGGSLRGAKNIAKMIALGSRLLEEPVSIVFSCCEDKYVISEDFKDLLELGIQIRETKWSTINRKSLDFIRNFKPILLNLMHHEYSMPLDGLCNFSDCDFWLLISDRTLLPLAPVASYGVVVYDYVQRYVPQLMQNHFLKANIKTVRNAHFIMTTTPHTRNDAIQYAGVSEDKVWNFPMEFSPPYLNIQTSSPYENAYFLWVTNTSIHKNHINALKALEIFYKEKNGNLDILMIGVNVELFRKTSYPTNLHTQKIARFIESSSILKQKCRIIGEVSDAEYAQYLKHAQFLWHPTLIDNGTFTVVEAAYLNTPSTSSAYPAMQFMNERFSLNLLFTDPSNPRDMALKLKQMEETAHERKKSLPSREHLDKFTADSLALDFWKTLKQYLP